MADYRVEKDSLGEVKVPKEAMYGPQTQRAVENFPVSGIRFQRVFIRALGLIKGCAADVNSERGLLDGEKACTIRQAADEVVDVVDGFADAAESVFAEGGIVEMDREVSEHEREGGGGVLEVVHKERRHRLERHQRRFLRQLPRHLRGPGRHERRRRRPARGGR